MWEDIGQEKQKRVEKYNSTHLSGFHVTDGTGDILSLLSAPEQAPA